MIDYTGIDESFLVNALYHWARSCDLHTPAAMIELCLGGPRVTVDTVRADLGDCSRYIDYYRGRPLKIQLDTIAKQFDPRSYDRDAGDGTAQFVVTLIRAVK